MLGRQLDNETVVKRPSTAALERLPGGPVALEFAQTSAPSSTALPGLAATRRPKLPTAARDAVPSPWSRIRPQRGSIPGGRSFSLVGRRRPSVLVEPPFPEAKRPSTVSSFVLFGAGGLPTMTKPTRMVPMANNGSSIASEKLRAGVISPTHRSRGPSAARIRLRRLSFDPRPRVAHESRRRSRSNPFAVTPNELRTSQADPSNFYRVFDYGPGGLYILEGDLEPLLELTPTQYSARLKPRVVNLRGFAAGRHDGIAATIRR